MNKKTQEFNLHFSQISLDMICSELEEGKTGRRGWWESVTIMQAKAGAKTVALGRELCVRSNGVQTGRFTTYGDLKG